VLVAPLVLLLALGVVQLALSLHVRTTLVAAAAEGARTAAASGRSAADGRARVLSLVDGSFAAGVVTSVDVRPTRRRGLDLVVVRVRARLPLVGLLGPESLVVTGTALREPA
jgi:Flp pilus assembly protein TadG